MLKYIFYHNLPMHSPSRKLIVLDPGHGGRQPGAVSGVITEAKLTRSITLLLKHKLLSDNKLDALTSYEIANKRIDDTWEPEIRKKLLAAFDKAHSHIDLLLTIHLNSVARESPSGLVIGHYTRPEKAQIMYDSILATVSPSGYSLAGNRAETIQERPELALLNIPGIPSLLIEAGFLSNPQELQFLINMQNQHLIAQGIANGCYKLLLPEPST